jgi:NosR/NirI family nitrous oxide reductase transcriptional regulator
MTLPSSKLPSHGNRRWQRWLVGLMRLGLIAAAMACLWFDRDDEELDANACLTAAQEVYPDAVTIGDLQEGWLPLLSGRAELLGWVTTTNPQAKRIQGYSGPSELMVIADPMRRVKRVRFWKSSDTAGHVEIVRRDSSFWNQWDGRSETSLGIYETPRLVSGASVTSEAMARGLAARFGAEGLANDFSRDLLVKDVVPWFPNATALQETDRPGCWEVRDAQQRLGYVLRSSRMAVAVRGFNGASDVLVAIDAAESTVLGIAMLETRDNEPYITDVRDELRYTNGFAGVPVRDLVSSEDHTDYLLVSGASTTARAVWATAQEMIRRHLLEQQPWAFPWRVSLGMAWLAAGLWFGFRGGKKSRALFALCSVIAGLTLGWMVGQDQLLGWGRNGWQSLPALPLLTMTAIALIVPAFTGKNVYCSRICPHGAAQTLVGMAIKKRWSLPAKWHRVFASVPWFTLVAIWGLAIAGMRWPFAQAEPFEVWSTGFYALLPAAIFTVGLLTAFFLPQGYCHYGCPTGALLKFLTHSPGRWTRRDGIAALLVAVAWLTSFL